MIGNRFRFLTYLDSSQLLKVVILSYTSLNLISLLVVVIISIVPLMPVDLIDHRTQISSTSTSIYLIGAFCLLNLTAAGTAFLLWRKFKKHQSGAGNQITAALDKIRQGDLGWKITLPGGSELARVADSVSLASESLADRVSTLKVKTRELAEVEDFLVDSLTCDGARKPYTLKALRKLRICISRLRSDMEEFQTLSSADTFPKTEKDPPNPVSPYQST